MTDEKRGDPEGKHEGTFATASAPEPTAGGREDEIGRLTRKLSSTEGALDAYAREAARLRAPTAGEPVAWRWKDSGHRDWHYRKAEPCDLKHREGIVMEPLFAAPASAPEPPAPTADGDIDRKLAGALGSIHNTLLRAAACNRCQGIGTADEHHPDCPNRPESEESK